MTSKDTCCTLAPYFTIHKGKIDDFKTLCERFVELTETEPKCMFYGFSFDGQSAHCCEGYIDADGILAHLENVGDALQEALQIADLERLEVHGPDSELAKLQAPLSELSPQYFRLEYDFRRH